MLKFIDFKSLRQYFSIFLYIIQGVSLNFYSYIKKFKKFITIVFANCDYIFPKINIFHYS